MIPSWKEARIVELLADESLTQREIARRTRVSPVTVSNIKQGKRDSTLSRSYVLDRDQEDVSYELSSGPPVRCKCGYLVYMPCQICRAREGTGEPMQIKEEIVNFRRRPDPTPEEVASRAVLVRAESLENKRQEYGPRNEYDRGPALRDEYQVRVPPGVFPEAFAEV